MRIKYGRLWAFALIFLVMSLCTTALARDHVFKEIELVGTSPISWNEAIEAIIASEHVKDKQTIEVKELEVRIADHRIVEYLAKVTLLAAFERGDREDRVVREDSVREDTDR